MEEFKEIVEVIQDISGKWRVRVEFSTFSQYFKFQEFPTNEEILIEAEKYITNYNINENTKLQ